MLRRSSRAPSQKHRDGLGSRMLLLFLLALKPVCRDGAWTPGTLAARGGGEFGICLPMVDFLA